jgi:hypothetical protein
MEQIKTRFNAGNVFTLQFKNFQRPSAYRFKAQLLV